MKEKANHLPGEEDCPDHGVCNCMPWCHKWTQSVTGNHGPIQSEYGWGEERHSTKASEQLVYYDIVWLDPSDPRNSTQTLWD